MRGIFKILMLKDDRGDTLIEVSLALAILSFVVVGATVLTENAFRLGQTADERTQISEAAQQQLEALHSFRDNHTWTPTASSEFQYGSSCGAPGGYCGVVNGQGPTNLNHVLCRASTNCFHMEAVGAPGTEWVPTAGPLPQSLSPLGGSAQADVELVPLMTTSNEQHGTNCGYDFELTYSFIPLGSTSSQRDGSTIDYRLVNLTRPVGAATCP